MQKLQDNGKRVDETYIKVKGQWMYLYCTVNSEGNIIDFYLSESRDKQATKRYGVCVCRTAPLCYNVVGGGASG